MTRQFLLAALAAALCLSGDALAQQKGERDPDVDNALKRAYPEAQTEVQGLEQINGVRVFNVTVTGKGGSSTAQVTEYGDFLSYGVPQRNPELRKTIGQEVGQLFQSTPSDIQLYRRTFYLVDVPVQQQEKKGGEQQLYQIVLDPVGRVLDIRDPGEIEAAKMATSEVVKDEKLAKRLEQLARERALGKESDLQRLSVSKVPGYFEVDIGQSAATLNEQGQILQTRRDVPGPNLPLPVRQTVDQLVKSSLRAQRVEEEYFQFSQKSATGNEIIVKMRPDGNIIDVVNPQAQQEEQAVTAKHKQTADQEQQKQPGS